MIRTAEFLELIYTTIDWPLQTPNLKVLAPKNYHYNLSQVSLEQSGKSRSDLWQLAGLVALEQAVERANRACDLDFHARQQVTTPLSVTKNKIMCKRRHSPGDPVGGSG